MGALLKLSARLWTPGQFKPLGVPRIDWSHPLARGLIFYGFDTGQGLVVDLARSRPMGCYSAGGGPLPATSCDQWQGGFLYDANHTVYFASDAEIQNATASPPWTCACAIDQLTLATGAICFCRTANNSGGQPYVNWAFQSDFSGGAHTTFAVNSASTYTYIGAGSTGVAVGTNGFHTLVGVANSSASATYYVDGVSEGTTTGLSIQSINSGDAICCGGNSSLSNLNPCASAFVPYGAFWNRALSAWEALQLHLDPYCFLVPSERELPALSVGGTYLGLSGLGAVRSAGRAGVSGRAGLAAAASASTAAKASMTGEAALLGFVSMRASGRTAPSGNAALGSRGVTYVRGAAAPSGLVALFGRMGATSQTGVKLAGTAALAARSMARGAGALASGAHTTMLTARATFLAAGRAGFRGVVELATSSFAAAAGRLVAFFGANLNADPRFTILLPYRRQVSQLGLPMPQGPDFSQMEVGETITGAIDFARWMPSGVAISSIVSVTATNDSPASGGPPYVTLSGGARIGAAAASAGGAGVNNAAVLQQWQGLAPGVARITVTIETSDGQTLIGWAHQPVGQPN